MYGGIVPSIYGTNNDEKNWVDFLRILIKVFCWKSYIILKYMQWYIKGLKATHEK